MSLNSNMMDVSCGGGTMISSGAHGFTPGFTGVHAAQFLSLYFVRCFFFHLVITLCVLHFLFTVSDHPNGIFELYKNIKKKKKRQFGCERLYCL